MSISPDSPSYDYKPAAQLPAMDASDERAHSSWAGELRKTPSAET